MASLLPNTLTYDITAYLGDTLSCALTWKDASGACINFAGCTGLGQIKLLKTDATPAAAFTVTLGSTTNNLQFALSAAQVLALGVGKWFYDIQITTANGLVRTYVVGKLKITQDVTRV